MYTIAKRLSEAKSSGIQKQSPEQLLNKLQKEVKDLMDRKDQLESTLKDKESQFEQLSGWGGGDRAITDEDVNMKRDQVQEMDKSLADIQDRLDSALENNQKLLVFRQAAAIAIKRFREKEDEVDRLVEEKRRIQKLIEDKESELQASGVQAKGKMDLKKYGAIVRDKIEKYKRMREELASLRAELVILQRTEAIVKDRDKNIEEFLSDLEKKKGVEGYRATQQSLEDMTQQTAAVDQMKGATLEQISQLVEQIGREFRNKQAQLQPIIAELKVNCFAYR